MDLKGRIVFDVAIIGGGPAGASCAAFLASGGLRVLLLERSIFPREKVCGDCLNPLAWGVLDQLRLREKVLACTHSVLEGVRFLGIDGTCVRVPLPQGTTPELGLTRARLDQVLLEHAGSCGVEIYEDATLKSLERLPHGWRLQSGAGVFEASQIVAADGRNSTVARLLGHMPPPLPMERIAVQTHLPSPAGLEKDVLLQFVKEGYAGLAPVGGNTANLCLVCRPSDLQSIKHWASRRFALSSEQTWRSITPLRRAPLPATGDRLWFTGDSARVVEPFTGEGIAYALRTGALCAEALLAGNPEQYEADHAALYRGRLWVNQLARWACLHPKAGSALVQAGRFFPSIFSLLTQKVVAKTLV